MSLVPEVIYIFYCTLDDIKDCDGNLLVIRGDGAIVDEGFQGLAVFSLKHALLFSSFFGIIFPLCVYIRGFDKVNSMCVKGFPFICLIGGKEGEFGTSQQGLLLPDVIISFC